MTEPILNDRLTGAVPGNVLDAARSCFADRGLAATTAAEIAGRSGVSEAVISEIYGGPDGLYALIVDLAVGRLQRALREALNDPYAGSRRLVERAVRALVDYIEACPECFRLIMRDFAEMGGFGAATIIGDATAHVESLLLRAYQARGVDVKSIPLVAQALTGMVAITGQWWLAHPEFTKQEVVEQLISLTWNGIHHIGLEPAAG